jgi:hypothetical protein
MFKKACGEPRRTLGLFNFGAIVMNIKESISKNLYIIDKILEGDNAKIGDFDFDLRKFGLFPNKGYLEYEDRRDLMIEFVEIKGDLKGDLNEPYYRTWDALRMYYKNGTGKAYLLGQLKTAQQILRELKKDIDSGDLIPKEDVINQIIKTIQDTLEPVKEKIQEQERSLTIQKNELRATTNKLLIYKKRRDMMSRFSPDYLKEVIERHRKKNGTINYSAVGRELGINHETAKKIIKRII